MTTRVKRNALDGIEYLASIVGVDKLIPMDIDEDEESLAHLFMKGRRVRVKHEIAVGRKSNILSAVFTPTCIAFISDHSSSLDMEAVHRFVDQFLEFQDFSTFSENDPLEAILSQFEILRTRLKTRKQPLLGMRRVPILLFLRDPSH